MAVDPSTLRSGLPADAPSRGGPSGGPSPEDGTEGRRRRREGRIAEAQGPDDRGTPAAPSRSRGRKAPSRRRRKARMVHRVVRHVEVWSVAKIAVAFAVCGYVIGMVSGYLLWRAADRVGTIEGIEGFVEDNAAYNEGTFTIAGDVVFTSAALGGAVLAALFAAACILGAVLFNLISDLTGGIRMTAVDEDLIVMPARRPEAETARRPEAETARRPEAETARRPSENGRGSGERPDPEPTSESATG